MTWIKICGTTSLEDARLALDAGADALGFVFAPSPRQVEPEQAHQIVSQLPATAEAVGVFVNETAERILEIAEQVGLTGVQLHGDEYERGEEIFFRCLKSERREGILRVISVLPAHALESNEATSAGIDLEQAALIDAVMVDSGSSARRGGTGAPFDWDRLSEQVGFLKSFLPLIVAGGLHAGNVAQAIRVLRPWGVDVVSGVEREPGKKDPEKVRAFVQAVRRMERGD